MDEDVGFRFPPTDRELCTHYLPHKNAGNDARVKAINEVNLYAHEPEELPGLSKMNGEKDHVCYLFSHQDAKYPKSQTTIIRKKESGKLTRKIREGPIMNRSTRGGSWSPTGNDREIKLKGRVIGFKKTLVFYRRGNGKGKGERTNWVMHEYRLASISSTGRNYVICKVKKREDDKSCVSTSEISHPFACDPVNLPSSSYIVPKNDDHENHQPVADRSIVGLGKVVSREDSRSDQSIVGLGKAPGGCEIDFRKIDFEKESLTDLVRRFCLELERPPPAATIPGGFYDQISVSDYEISCGKTPGKSIVGEYIHILSSDSDSESETAHHKRGYAIRKTNYEVGQPSHSIASDYVDLYSASKISSDIKNQMQVTAAELLNTPGQLGVTTVEHGHDTCIVQPQSTAEWIKSLPLYPEDNNQMLVTTADSLNGFGASGVNMIESPYRPDNGYMLKESTMWIPSSNFGQPSHSIASDYVNLASTSNISSDVKNQMQVTAAESLNPSGRLGATAVDLPNGHDTGIVQPESIEDLINSLLIDPEDTSHMLVPAADSLNAAGGSSVNVIDWPYGPDIDSMLKETAMWDEWKRSISSDPEPVTEQQANPHGCTIRNPVYHTNHSCYRQLQSIPGEYVDTESDTDSEATEQQNLDEISSPIDGDCSSEGSNTYEVDILEKDYSTEDSAVMGQFSGDIMTKEYEYTAKEAAEPRKAMDQSEESPAELSSTKMMQACAEESVITETLSKSQNKVIEAAEPRIMNFKSLMIHLLLLVISIVGFKQLLYAKQIHNHNV